jgi:hypothetical protein
MGTAVQLVNDFLHNGANVANAELVTAEETSLTREP